MQTFVCMFDCAQERERKGKNGSFSWNQTGTCTFDSVLFGAFSGSWYFGAPPHSHPKLQVDLRGNALNYEAFVGTSGFGLERDRKQMQLALVWKVVTFFYCFYGGRTEKIRECVVLGEIGFFFCFLAAKVWLRNLFGCNFVWHRFQEEGGWWTDWWLVLDCWFCSEFVLSVWTGEFDCNLECR